MVKRITELVEVTSTAPWDVIAVVDVSDTTQNPTGSTRKLQTSYLKDRSNHTWSQAISTVSWLQTSLDSKQETSEKGLADGYASLDSWGKVPLSELPESITWGKNNLWLWNSSTNTPTIVSWVGNQWDFYTVKVAWTTNIDGISTREVNDTIIFDETLWVWEKISSTKNNLYGLEYFTSYSVWIDTTTLTAFQNKLSITETLLWGDYRIEVSYWWNHDSTNTDFESELVVDAGIIPGYPTAFNSVGSGTLIHKEEPRDSWGNIWWTGSAQVMNYNQSFLVSLSSGPHTIDLNYRTDWWWDESSIWAASISIIRVW